MKKRHVALALALLPTSVLAADHFLLIGGGPSPRASEAQIEYNVNWVVASLRDLVPDAAISVFFAGGADAPNTAVELRPRAAEASLPMSALASIYGEEGENRLLYRAHRVPDVVSSTRRDVLATELERRLVAMRPGDQAMIIYNGHGSWASDRSQNALRLWDESRLSVREFETLLGRVDPAVPVRFVFTQCYSGAFSRAVYPKAQPSLLLASGKRCGFFAESSERESEGCSASIELGDYRDYTTYFFAGLTGKDRLGRPVAAARDRDADGRVSPFDAHLYTLLEGYNGDLPRSTSEDYLERWMPWYGRWLETGSVPGNIYGELAREMARRAGLPEDGRGLGVALTEGYNALLREQQGVTARRGELVRHADSMRLAMQRRLERRWPMLAAPYTAAYRDILNAEGDSIEHFARADSAFANLRANEDSISAVDVQLIDLDRRISRLDKLRRTRMLARALNLLDRTAARRHRDAYQQLRQCEALPLGKAPPPA